MSEYQFLAFRAIDGPVSEKNLQYMRRQSSRAEITPWSFENEYHYGDFGGDEVEMMKRGYDIHLHYANFGIRKLMIRLPNGFPDPGAAKPYLSERLTFDKSGHGGILTVEPYDESGSLDVLYDIADLLDRLVPLRAEIFDGDLRPLYLASVAVASDDEHDPMETIEAPVPAGLKKLSKAQEALAELYGLDANLITAAARESPPLADRDDLANDYNSWLKLQPSEIKDGWLAQLMADAQAPVRGIMIAEFRKSRKLSSWPITDAHRTMETLRRQAEEVAVDAQNKTSAKAARTRTKKLAAMLANPIPTLKETEDLAAMRGTDAYCQIADLLSDLREALTETSQSKLAEEQARKLVKANPTLTKLTKELRQKGFIPKGK